MGSSSSAGGMYTETWEQRLATKAAQVELKQRIIAVYSISRVCTDVGATWVVIGLVCGLNFVQLWRVRRVD